MGYKTKSMIYAKSLKANLNLTGEEEKKKGENTISVSGMTVKKGKEALTKAGKQAEDEAEKRSNSWITEGALGKNTKTQDNFFDGTGAKALPEREPVQDFTRMIPKAIPQFPEKSPGSDELIKTGSKKTKAKEAGAYSAGTKLLDKTGKEVGQDAGVLSGLASGSAGTQVGTAIGIMVNKMDKSPRSTAKFDSKIKKAQGRGNLAKAARLEKREAGYAYRQEKRATRIDPTYKGKTDNTKAEKLKAGKIRRASISEARKKASNDYFAGEADKAIKKGKATPTVVTKVETAKGSTTGTKGSTKVSTKRSTTGTKRSTKVGKNTVLPNSNKYKGATGFLNTSIRPLVMEFNKPKPTNPTGNAAAKNSRTNKPGTYIGKPGPSNVKNFKNSNNEPAGFLTNEWFENLSNKDVQAERRAKLLAFKKSQGSNK